MSRRPAAPIAIRFCRVRVGFRLGNFEAQRLGDFRRLIKRLLY
jgi:hypothetical protein